jgi:hypothetical protein
MGNFFAMTINKPTPSEIDTQIVFDETLSSLSMIRSAVYKGLNLKILDPCSEFRVCQRKLFDSLHEFFTNQSPQTKSIKDLAPLFERFNALWPTVNASKFDQLL